MSAKAAHTPLAERLRPRSLSEVIGQQQVLGEGMALRVAFESGQPHSCILLGPPGVGKTTIARLMADAFGAQFLAWSPAAVGLRSLGQRRGTLLQICRCKRPVRGNRCCIAAVRPQ
jgi:putative ATPase